MVPELFSMIICNSMGLEKYGNEQNYYRGDAV